MTIHKDKNGNLHDDDGGRALTHFPVDLGPYTPVTDEEAAANRLSQIPAITPEQARADRDSRIEEIRWRIERYTDQKAAGAPTTDTAAQYASVLQYVQGLRDITLQAGFPASVNWPVVP